MHRGIFLGVLAAILLLALGGSPGSDREVAQSAATALAVLAFAEVLAICLLTPVFLAGVLAREADPKTWEILLTTPLSGVQIILGNLFGRLFFVFALLLSALPLFLVLQGFGGVRPESILATTAIAMMTALFMGSVAVALSVTRMAGKRTMLAFYGVVVSWLAVTAAADAMLRTSVGTGLVSTTIATPLSPLLALESVIRSATYVPHDTAGWLWPASIWMGKPALAFGVWTGTASLVCVVFALARVRSAGMAAVSASGGTGESRAPHHVGKNPIAWRELHLRAQRRSALIARWTLVPLGWLLAFVPPILHTQGVLTTTSWQTVTGAMCEAETLVVLLVALTTAATAVTTEREDGSLDILLTTPIQPTAYIRGKLLGLVRYVLPLASVPVATLGIGALYSAFATVIADDGSATTGLTTTLMTRSQTTLTLPALEPLAAGLFAPSLVCFLALATMVGLSTSVRAKGTVGAALSAGATILSTTGIAVLLAFAMASASVVLGGCGVSITPFTLAAAASWPADYFASAASDAAELREGRVALGIGSALGMGLCLTLAWGIAKPLEKNFMMLVRRHSGRR